ncbi:GntR family transcriptional regulator [Collimonas sp. OK307]|uniref:GntR family transcriptional regulator n=1 Tax=Collimonas sp. OK307 TaxID=1801620 RepID=UPI0008EFE017|nr:GntR family transcriptional regulator [Collimonas sp. OK307]SFI37995.1 GntR family transcriptional regulator [Collimonas sp. OK307]
MKDTETPGQPRYKWLANIIGSTIGKGMLSDNQALPSERELAERYDVSRDTVRKAVRYMEERGIIYSDHGRGTFVAPAIVRDTTRFIDSFSQDADSRGSIAGQQLLSVGMVPASMAIAGLLNVKAGDPLFRVHRIRTMDNVAVGLHDAYFTLPVGAKISRSQVERAGSLYKLLGEKFNFSPAEAVENLSAATAEFEDARLLGTEVGTPLLVCERITLSDRRQPVEYCLMKYLSNYRYKTRIAMRGGD